jgi:hypothetical protein
MALSAPGFEMGLYQILIVSDLLIKITDALHFIASAWLQSVLWEDTSTIAGLSFVFDLSVRDKSLFKAILICREFKLPADIPIRIRGGVVRILIRDSCIRAIVPVTAY